MGWVMLGRGGGSSWEDHFHFHFQSFWWQMSDLVRSLLTVCLLSTVTAARSTHDTQADTTSLRVAVTAMMYSRSE